MWILAQTLATQEFHARKRLDANASIHAYVPTYRRSVRDRFTRERRIITAPLLPRYLFLFVESVAQAIHAMRDHGDIWPVRSDYGSCLIVPERDMAQLITRTAAGEFDELSPAQRFPVGAIVTLPLADHRIRGIVTQHLSRRRARIELETISVTARFDTLKIAE
jgi:hypothetical protein